MAYVGRGLTTGAQYQKLDTISIDDATTFTMQVGGTAVTPAPEHLILAVNGVIQEPNVGFTLSGSTCTLASAIDNDGGSDTIWGMIAGDAAYAAVTALNNATANELVTVGSTTTELDAEANLTFTGSALTCIGTMTVGVDNTGHDVKFFGDTTGKYMLWDESADKLIVSGIIETTDLILHNERGHYTIVEEEDYLGITNENTGKKYKFVLEEIE